VTVLAQTMGRLRAEEAGRRAIRFERLYDYRPDELWAALTEPEQLRGWLGDADVDLRVGGRIVIRFGNGDEEVASGTIRELEPPRLLEYDWTFLGESDSVLRLELEPRGSGTLLILDHRRLTETVAVGYSAGWHAHLDRLEALHKGERVDWDERFAELVPRYRETAQAL
jgi:uncharacterized protein YndB with AHSA1/START domain